MIFFFLLKEKGLAPYYSKLSVTVLVMSLASYRHFKLLVFPYLAKGLHPKYSIFQTVYHRVCGIVLRWQSAVTQSVFQTTFLYWQRTCILTATNCLFQCLCYFILQRFATQLSPHCHERLTVNTPSSAQPVSVASCIKGAYMPNISHYSC